jgi:hypothetical protein
MKSISTAFLLTEPKADIKNGVYTLGRHSNLLAVSELT